ncbi:MAG: AbrB/MazE/SpoVT family DNA-binding domain-containing protein [Limnochordia bacterium]
MWKAKVTSKGQVTIPKDVRFKIGLTPGDTLEIKETQHGFIISKAVNPEALKKYIGCVDLKNVC